MNKTSNWGTWALLVCAMAFGFAWFDMPGYGSAFAGQHAALALHGIDGHTLFLVGMLALAAIELTCCRWLERHTAAILIACLIVGTATLALYCLPVPCEIVALSVVLTGFANVLFTTTMASSVLGRALYHEGLTGAIVVALAGKTLIAYVANRYLGPTAQIALLVATPSLCVGCAFAALRHAPAASAGEAADHVKFKQPSSGLMLGMVFATALVFAATRVVSNLGFWGSEYSLTQWGPLSALVITVAYGVLCHFTLVRGDSRLLFRFLPALFTLFALYVFLYTGLGEQLGLSQAFGAVLSQYAELYGQTFMWAVLLLSLRTLPMPPFRILGILFGTYTVAELALQQCLVLASGASLAIILFTFFAMLAVLTWALCHFYGKDGFEQGADALLVGTDGCNDCTACPATAPDAAAAVPQALPAAHVGTVQERRALAALHGLSERETEVFLLLAQGRTRKFICDELFISPGTASSYTSRVYEKFGVHSKQELLTLVLKQEVDEGAAGSATPSDGQR